MNNESSDADGARLIGRSAAAIVLWGFAAVISDRALEFSDRYWHLQFGERGAALGGLLTRLVVVATLMSWVFKVLPAWWRRGEDGAR